MTNLSDLNPGDTVRITGFTCIADGETREVLLSSDGLYVSCSNGMHFLDGQCEETDELIGVEKL